MLHYVDHKICNIPHANTQFGDPNSLQPVIFFKLPCSRGLLIGYSAVTHVFILHVYVNFLSVVVVPESFVVCCIH